MDGSRQNAGDTCLKESVGRPVNVTNGNMWLKQSDYQSLLLVLFVSIGIGYGVVYLLYAIPYILLFPRNDAEKIEISIFVIAAFPLVIYAILFGLGVCLVGKLKAKN